MFKTLSYRVCPALSFLGMPVPPTIQNLQMMLGLHDEGDMIDEDKVPTGSWFLTLTPTHTAALTPTECSVSTSSRCSCMAVLLESGATATFEKQDGRPAENGDPIHCMAKIRAYNNDEGVQELRELFKDLIVAEGESDV